MLVCGEYFAETVMMFTIGAEEGLSLQLSPYIWRWSIVPLPLMLCQEEMVFSSRLPKDKHP